MCPPGDSDVLVGAQDVNARVCQHHPRLGCILYCELCLPALQQQSALSASCTIPIPSECRMWDTASRQPICGCTLSICQPIQVRRDAEAWPFWSCWDACKLILLNMQNKSMCEATNACLLTLPANRPIHRDRCSPRNVCSHIP